MADIQAKSIRKERHKFKPGTPRPPGSGRAKGTPNKQHYRKVSEMLAEAGLHPASEILRIMAEEDLKPAEQVRTWLELLAYCEPKAKVAVGDEKPDGAGELLKQFENVTDAALLKVVANGDG